MFEFVTKRVKNCIKSVAHYDRGIDIAENSAISYNTTLLYTLRVRICARLLCVWKLANIPIPHTPCVGMLLVICIVLFVAACWALPVLADMPGDNLLLNPSFFNGLDHWNVGCLYGPCNYGYDVVIGSMACDFDGYHLRLLGPYIGQGYQTFAQDVDVGSGGTFYFSIWRNYPNLNDGFGMRIDGSDVGRTDTIYGSWVHSVATVTVTSGPHAVLFYGSAGNYRINHYDHEIGRAHV